FPQDYEDSERQKFLEFVPFKNIASKTFEFEKFSKLVAINNNFYDGFKSEFEKHQLFIKGVIPLSAILLLFPQMSTHIDLSVISSKIDSLKEYFIISAQDAKSPQLKENKSANRSLPILISIFIFLILVLIVIIVGTSKAA